MKKNLILFVLSVYGILYFIKPSEKENAYRSISSISDGEVKLKLKSILKESSTDMQNEKIVKKITEELEKVQALKDKKKKKTENKSSKKYLKEDDIINEDNSNEDFKSAYNLDEKKRSNTTNGLSNNLLLSNALLSNNTNQNNNNDESNESNNNSNIDQIQVKNTESYQQSDNQVEAKTFLSFQLTPISEKNESKYLLKLMDCSGEVIQMSSPLETTLNCGDNYLDLSSLSDGDISFEITDGMESHIKTTVKSTVGKYLYHDYLFSGQLFNFDRQNKHHLFNLSQTEIYQEQYMIPNNNHNNVIRHNMSLSEFTFSFQMLTNNIITTQTILDFGRNNRGLALIIDNGNLKLRAHSNSISYELNTTLLESELCSVHLSYKDGLLNLTIPELNVNQFLEIPNFILTDYNESGYFRNYSRNSFNQSAVNMLQNPLKYFKLFTKKISYEDLKTHLENEEKKESWEIGLEYNFNFKNNNIISNALPIINLDNYAINDDYLNVNNKTLFQLNDGYFFNKEFSKRSYFFQFKSQGNGYLLDEGGSVNGISLIIDENTIYAHIRNNTQQYNSISYDLSIEDWNNVILTIENDQATLWVNGNELVMMLEHQKLNRHPDRGGLFNCYNSSSNNSSCNSHNSGFNGKVKKVYIYDRVLNIDEINYLNNL